MRRRRWIAALLLAALTLPILVGTAESAGTASDPFATLSYIMEKFMPTVENSISVKATSAFEAMLLSVSNKGQTKITSLSSALTEQNLVNAVKSSVARSIALTKSAAPSKSPRTVVLAKGDKITGPAGVGVMLLSGTAKNSGPSGSVLINVSAGKELPSGGALTVRTQYLLSEKTGCAVTVTSETAMLQLGGRYTLTPEVPVYGAKYTDLAWALKKMNMLAGSNRGFELSKTLNRAEGAVMLARLLGAEAEAAAYALPIPFTDVPSWAFPFVSYAFHNGLLYGKTVTRFDPSGPLTKEQYVTMVLRALGYADTGETPDFVWDKSLEKAVQVGLLTQSETAMIAKGPFYRDYMVYVSYYALDAVMKNGGATLQDYLIARGVTDTASAAEARGLINRVRP